MPDLRGVGHPALLYTTQSQKQMVRFAHFLFLRHVGSGESGDPVLYLLGSCLSMTGGKKRHQDSRGGAAVLARAIVGINIQIKLPNFSAA